MQIPKKIMFITFVTLCLMLLTTCADGEVHEDRRCSCICLDVGTNKSRGAKTFYQDNHVLPEQCNCNDMVLPRIVNKVNVSLLTYCIQCDCRFETRNTTVVMIVVVTLLVIISVLMLYMTCLGILQQIVKHRKIITNTRLGNEEQSLGLLHDDRHDTSDAEY